MLDRCTIYFDFKQNTDLEGYLTQLEKREYLNLFKFRTANHHLPVETGRYDGTPFSSRKCQLCASADVGTEKHYLLQCEYFMNDRNMYLGADLTNLAIRNKMQYFLSDAPVYV